MLHEEYNNIWIETSINILTILQYGCEISSGKSVERTVGHLLYLGEKT